MKFSVIIPTYKGTDSLGIAISSVLYQTYRNYEIIISDDNEIGSKEQIETEAIVSKVKTNNQNIIYLKNGHHNGSYARNRAIEKATGEYITLLDDDDFYCKDYLYKSNQILEKNNNISLLFFDVLIITSEKIVKKSSYKNIDSKKLLFGQAEIGTGSNLCFKNKKGVLFDERYLRHQDIEFACKRMQECNYMWIEETEIIKYHNQNDNYPNVDKALITQELLREDMFKNKIIEISEIKELEKIQLHSLYKDLLVKNADLLEIRKIVDILKEKNIYTSFDFCLFFVYRFSRVIFNFFINTYSRKKFSVVDDKIINNVNEIRKSLEGFI